MMFFFYLNRTVCIACHYYAITVTYMNFFLFKYVKYLKLEIYILAKLLFINYKDSDFQHSKNPYK